jgi:hypothetical protein
LGDPQETSIAFVMLLIEALESNGARIGRETEEEPVSSRPESRRTTSYSSSFFFVRLSFCFYFSPPAELVFNRKKKI